MRKGFFLLFWNVQCDLRIFVFSKIFVHLTIIIAGNPKVVKGAHRKRKKSVFSFISRSMTSTVLTVLVSNNPILGRLQFRAISGWKFTKILFYHKIYSYLKKLSLICIYTMPNISVFSRPSTWGFFFRARAKSELENNTEGWRRRGGIWN